MNGFYEDVFRECTLKDTAEESIFSPEALSKDLPGYSGFFR